MGYRTLAGDLGSTLSGGQRQRLLLARALYRKPAILILDEGTANLDAENERSVMATVADMAITRIVVAHRQGAMNGANRFLDVREGSIRDVTDASDSGADSSEPVDAT
jgi:ATP-binding cassette subfamily B protein RaxB